MQVLHCARHSWRAACTLNLLYAGAAAARRGQAGPSRQGPRKFQQMLLKVLYAVAAMHACSASCMQELLPADVAELVPADRQDADAA